MINLLNYVEFSDIVEKVLVFFKFCLEVIILDNVYENVFVFLMFFLLVNILYYFV